jgi:hypothetical protein
MASGGAASQSQHLRSEAKSDELRTYHHPYCEQQLPKAEPWQVKPPVPPQVPSVDTVVGLEDVDEVVEDDVFEVLVEEVFVDDVVVVFTLELEDVEVEDAEVEDLVELPELVVDDVLVLELVDLLELVAVDDVLDIVVDGMLSVKVPEVNSLPLELRYQLAAGSPKHWPTVPNFQP